MRELDDDDNNMVDSNGKHTERDLVQFVEFKKFQNNGVNLAKQVLEELPRQVSEYYQLMGLTPDDIVNSYKSISFLYVFRLRYRCCQDSERGEKQKPRKVIVQCLVTQN